MVNQPLKTLAYWLYDYPIGWSNIVNLNWKLGKRVEVDDEANGAAYKAQGFLQAQKYCALLRVRWAHLPMFARLLLNTLLYSTKKYRF